MKPAKGDELDLASRLRQGDTGALEELYDLYFDRIYSVIFNQVGRDHSNAEDVTQETWLAAVKSVKRFKGQSEPYTWLCSIAWHKIRDFQRRHYRQMVKQQSPADQPDVATLRQMLDTQPLPQELLEREGTQELVHRALFALPGQYQQVLILKYVEDMPMKEIGYVLGKSTKSVDGLLRRARVALRDKIIQMSGGYGL
jgi:RNA polymerase sigma-70 factor (ECF subfamily)